MFGFRPKGKQLDNRRAFLLQETKSAAQPGVFEREAVKFRKASDGLAERQAAQAALEEEWLALMERDAG